MDGKINSIDKEIWYKKILNFCNRNITVVYISVGLLIILGYIFFFSSPYFIGGVDEDNLKFTAIGTTSKDGLGKEFTLENWEYCDAEDKMIVEISIENLVFDNVNDYTYSAKVQEVNSDIKTLQTEVVYKDKNYNVITISGVPDNMALVINGTLNWVSRNYPAGDYKIPDGVTKIQNSAIGYPNNVITVTIPESVDTFANYIFVGANNISAFYGKYTVDNRHVIKDDILYGAAVHGLTEYEIPEGVKGVAYKIFHFCTFTKKYIIIFMLNWFIIS